MKILGHSYIKREGQCDQIWQNFKSLWRFLSIGLSFSKFFNLLWQNNYAFGQTFNVVPKWPNIDKIILPSGHTVRGHVYENLINRYTY